MAIEEQILFSLPLSRMEPIFKGWVQDVLNVSRHYTPDKPEEELPIGIDEAVILTGYAKPTIYSKFSRREIPGYKRGQKLFFYRSELLDWIRSGKHSTLAEIKADAVKSLER